MHDCLTMKLLLSLFLCYSRREHPPYAEHLQRSEGDYKPRRHGAGCYPQLLPSLPAVHSAVHAGGGPAQPERKTIHRQQRLPQVWQNHAHHFWWWVLGMFPAISRCLCPCHPYLRPPGETAVSHITRSWIESRCLIFMIPIFKMDYYFCPVLMNNLSTKKRMKWIIVLKLVAQWPEDWSASISPVIIARKMTFSVSQKSGAVRFL